MIKLFTQALLRRHVVRGAYHAAGLRKVACSSCQVAQFGDARFKIENGDSRYALVIVAAKRARQINDYHHQLGEGIGFDQAPPPLVESRSKNYLTMALEEVAEGKLKYKYPK